MSALTARRLLLVSTALGVLLALSVGGALLVGPTHASLARALGPAGASSPDRTIIFAVRLPRLLLAAVVGGALASTGSALQALLRNPLADPHLLGISGGASVAAVVALLAGAHSATVALVAFGGALVSLAVVFAVAERQGRVVPHALLLAGVVYNALCAAAIMLAGAVADLSRAHGVLFWIMGSLAPRSYSLLALLTLFVALGLAVVFRHCHDLNLLAAGEEGALQLGVDVERARRRVFVASSLVVGAVVSVSGMIGFVGLVVPHCMRRLFGPDQRLLLPAAFLAGASFLAWADTLARTVLGPLELPVGVITALTGGPFFFVLLRRRAGEGFG